MGAIAGKVMIRPRGDYDPSAVYDILDLVKYDNKPWLCKKNDTMGIAPVDGDYWMNIIDISIANADTLDGHDSAYFAKATHGHTAEDVGAVSTNSFEITGFKKIKHEQYEADGDTRLISFYYVTDTTFWRVDAQAGSNMVRYRYIVDGETVMDVMSKNSDDYLPLTGGTLSGNLKLQKFDNGKSVIEKGHTASGDYGTQIYDYDKDGNLLALVLRANTELTTGLRITDGTSWYKLYGEHNKPTSKDVAGVLSNWDNAYSFPFIGAFSSMDDIDDAIAAANVGTTYSCRLSEGTNFLIIGYHHNFSKGYGAQLRISYQGSLLAIRSKIDGTWGAWNYLDDASSIKSGVLPVARGGTGGTAFPAGQAIIGNSTGAFTSRTILDNTATTGSFDSSSLITANTLKNALNRSSGVLNANTNYTTLMARGIALWTDTPTSMPNGTAIFVY